MKRIKNFEFDYESQLHTPEWKAKREEALGHDNYTCQICFKKDLSLEVHHKKYKYGRKAWQYDVKELISLCHDCHKLYHKEISILQLTNKLIMNL